MSRYYEKTQILISDDVANNPQNIRFNDTQEDTDITSLKKVRDLTDAYIVGTTSINLGSLTTALFLWIKPVSDVGIQLTGGPTLTLKGGKATKLWASFTSLSIIVPSTPINLVTPVQVSLVIGG